MKKERRGVWLCSLDQALSRAIRPVNTAASPLCRAVAGWTNSDKRFSKRARQDMRSWFIRWFRFRLARPLRYARAMTMRVTYKGHTYELKSEAAVIALCMWLAIQEADERIAA